MPYVFISNRALVDYVAPDRVSPAGKTGSLDYYLVIQNKLSRRKYGESGDYDNRERKRRRADAVEIEDRLESLIIIIKLKRKNT